MSGHFALLKRLDDESGMIDFIRERFENRKLEFEARFGLLIG
ncbi:hypothetical protein [Psychrobacillus sp. NPDC096623]